MRKTNKITAKHVRETENLPLPAVRTLGEMHAEPDEDEWGNDGLTFKQRRFCELYVGKCAGHITKSAIEAGYRESTAYSTGSENMKKPEIRGHIGRLLAKMRMTPEFLDARLAELASSSIENFTTYDDDGNPVIDLKTGLDRGCGGQIKEVIEEVIQVAGDSKVISRKIKTHDPLPAIRLLKEMHGEVVMRHEITGKDGKPIQEEVTHRFEHEKYRALFTERYGQRITGNVGGIASPDSN